MTAADDIAAVRARAAAAHYFDRHIAAPDRAAGMPEDMTEAGRRRYIRDATASAEAVRQITDLYPYITTSCVSCGHDQAEDLRWLDRDGREALCRSLLDCQRRRAAAGSTDGQAAR